MSTATASEGLERGPYDSGEERSRALRFGVYVFLGSETLLFAGLFALYVGYRAEYADVFARAVGFNEEWIGSVNTFVLLVSSFLVAWAELSMRRGRPAITRLCLGVAFLLGLTFLGLKSLEYTHHIEHGILPGHAYAFAELPEVGASLFFTLYYLLTGLHALHVMAGLTWLAWVGIGVQRTPEAPHNAIRVELAALYWHLVDLVWIFLWPILYLIH